MASGILRVLYLAGVVCALGAADQEIEAKLTELERQFHENHVQLQALTAQADAKKARRLTAAKTPSIFGDSATTRAYTDLENIQGAMTHAWLIMCGTLVMFMQAGFALLESGTCRKGFVQNILLKNLVDAAVGTMGWWVFGWSLAYSGPFDADGMKANGFAGGEQFFGHHFSISRPDGQIEPVAAGSSSVLANWFFSWTFAAAAATIVSGGVAERMMLRGYMVYSVLLTSFIYPIVIAWTWGGGFLAAMKPTYYRDFAGSGCVHLTGGIGALVGAIIAGPRPNRFKAARFTLEPPPAEGEKDEFKAHNLPMVLMGTIILWFGWYGFNCGSTMRMEDITKGFLAAQVAMNTTIAAATGGFFAFILRYVVTKEYDTCAFCNGILAGLVSITAPCGNIECGTAFLVGIVGAMVYQAASSLMKFCKIDDPLDAFAIHGACGIWGVMAAALFDWGKSFDTVHDGFDCQKDGSGGCEGNLGGYLIGANLAGVVCIILWVGVLSAIIFGILKRVGALVASVEEQQQGFDKNKHSPAQAYSMPSQEW